MQPEYVNPSQLMGIRLISPSPTILKESDTEPGVPISIQLTLNAPLERMQMDICDIWITLTRTTKIHTIKAKLKNIVSSNKISPTSTDAFKMVERSGGTIEDEILRLNASALILNGPDGLSSYTETPAAFHITLRIPGNLAGTVETTVGSISYTVSVNATTSSGASHVVGVPLYIRRLKRISSSEGSPTYLRRYPKTKMVSETRIPQVVSEDGIFQVQLILRSPNSSNGRTSTHLNVREAKWAVDELVRVISILIPNVENLPSQSREIKRCTRRLASGKINNSCFRASSFNNNMEANFDVSLNRKSRALCNVEQTYPDGPGNDNAKDFHPEYLHAAKRLDILVSHVLLIELVVDEVVLDNKTGQQLNLPALLRHVHGSNYILQVGDVKLENDPDGGIEYLPKYSKFPTDTSLVYGE